MTPIILLLLLIVSTLLFIVWTGWRKSKRADYIRTYMFPPGLIDKLGKVRPDLALKDQQLVARALRQYFLVYLKSGFRQVSMPSQLADDLWHEFILYTKHYQQFCKQAFGQYMHHTPAAVLGQNQHNNDGLRRTWWFACVEENINPKRATRLPLLFALDGKYDIADGFRYEANCSALRKNGDGTVYCGGDFYAGTGSNASDASDSSSFQFSDSHNSGDPSSSSDGSGCSGGCSGGCGGGGD
jgi:hypothetical protein